MSLRIKVFLKYIECYNAYKQRNIYDDQCEDDLDKFLYMDKLWLKNR